MSKISNVFILKLQQSVNNCFKLIPLLRKMQYGYCRVRTMAFNATFNNISDLSRRSVLLVEETRVPEENR